MGSRSDDTCNTDVYTIYSFHTSKLVDLWLIVSLNELNSGILTLTNGNEVKVRY